MYPINSDILAIFQSGAMQYARVTIGTAGQTGYQLIENDRIKQGSMLVNRFAETGDTVKVGSCASAELTLALDNRDGVYDDYDFVGKEAYVEIGVEDDNDIVYIPIGYFTFDEAAYDKSVLRLAALDRMLFFERTIVASQLSFPYTVTQLLSRICTVCGVPLGNIGTLLNGGISVPSLPNDAKTYRDLLVWIAEISGNVAYIAYDGTLMLKWYQGSQFSLTTANRKENISTLERGSVLITGVEVVVNDTTTLYGTADRTVRIENNPLIPSGQETFVATGVYNKVGGFSYTPFTASVLPMPHIEPLDGCTFVTADNESVFVPITDWSFTLNGSCRLAGKSNQATYQRGYGLADVILQGVNLADKAVTTAKIADNAVNTAQLAALAVQEGKIANGAVTNGKIYAGAVTADKIAALTILAGNIASGAITTDKIDAKAVTASKIDVTDLQALGATIGGWVIDTDKLEKVYTYDNEIYRTRLNSGNGSAVEVQKNITDDYYFTCFEVTPDGTVLVQNRFQDILSRVMYNGISLSDVSAGFTRYYNNITARKFEIECADTNNNTDYISRLTAEELQVKNRDLLKEFKAHTQYFATDIPANANLQTTAYLNAGRYVCRQTVTAATLSNCPVSTAFNMDVDYPISSFNTVPSTWGYILRTITAADGKQWIQYVAIDGNGTTTWNDWVQLRASTDGGNVIKQIRTNDANEYQLLFTEVVGRDSDTQLSRTRKNECLYYKPSSGELHLERASGITSNMYAYLIAGNSKIAGTDTGSNAGVLRLYGQKQYYAQIADTGNSLTAHRTYTLPNKDGELAILQSAELNVGNRNVISRDVDAAKYIGFATKAGGTCYLHYSAAGNHGILSSGYESSLTDTSTYTAAQVWVIERLGASGNVVIPNWSSIGGSQTPVYLNSSGRPASVSTTNGSGTASTTYINTGSANYAERCGIVTVSFSFKTKGTADTNKILFTNLPKPKIDTYAVLQGGATTTYRHLVVKINTSGQVVNASDVSDNNITWYGSITYPIA